MGKWLRRSLSLLWMFALGAKSCVGRLTHHGENRGYFRNKDRKARIRRFWKKKARREARKEICESV